MTNRNELTHSIVLVTNQQTQLINRSIRQTMSRCHCIKSRNNRGPTKYRHCRCLNQTGHLRKFIHECLDATDDSTLCVYECVWVCGNARKLLSVHSVSLKSINTHSPLLLLASRLNQYHNHLFICMYSLVDVDRIHSTAWFQLADELTTCYTENNRHSNSRTIVMLRTERQK